jgi:DNA-binding transcriptional ArsR family regulator
LWPNTLLQIYERFRATREQSWGIHPGSIVGKSLPTMDLTVLKSHARRASTLLKAMANERRLLILCHLAEGEHSVGELERLVGLSQSALSQHLARLRRDRLVRTRRSAQTIFYSLNGDEAPAIMAKLYEIYRFEPIRETRASGQGAPCAPH